jgi:hypothetical protein
MLSQDLLSLRSWFDTCRTGQQTMTPQGAEKFSRAIGACFAQAVAMENAPLAAIVPSDADVPQQSIEELIDTARMLANTTNIVMLSFERPLWGREGGVT